MAWCSSVDLVVVWPWRDVVVWAVSSARKMVDLYVVRMDCPSFVVCIFGVAPRINLESSLCDIRSRDPRRGTVAYYHSTCRRLTWIVTLDKPLQPIPISNR